MYAFVGGSWGICSCDNTYSSRFSIALFEWLFVALVLALGREDSILVEHLLSTIYDLSKHIFDQQ